VSCLEEIAYRRGFIDAVQLKRLAEKCGKSQYGKYLRNVLIESRKRSLVVAMQVTELKLSGTKLIQPQVFGDERGFFLETYNAPRYIEAGIDVAFVQDNHSRSVHGTLRGLHYQSEPGQAQAGSLHYRAHLDVVLDIRPTSPTFGQWDAVELDDQARKQLFVPVGFAHGFCVLSDFAEVQYKVSTPYDAKTECSISYADADLAVAWPIAKPLLSARDQQAESFASFRARVSP